MRALQTPLVVLLAFVTFGSAPAAAQDNAAPADEPGYCGGLALGGACIGYYVDPRSGQECLGLRWEGNCIGWGVGSDLD